MGPREVGGEQEAVYPGANYWEASGSRSGVICYISTTYIINKMF